MLTKYIRLMRVAKPNKQESMMYKTIKDRLMLGDTGQSEYVGINIAMLPKHDNYLLTPLDESVWMTEEEAAQQEWLEKGNVTCSDKTIEELLLESASEAVNNYYRGLLCVFEHSDVENILYLPLKEEWYRMIEAGIKTEEYRNINKHWSKRLIERMYIPVGMEYAPMAFMKPYTHVEFSLGYPKRNDWSRRMRFEIFNISMGRGKSEWGAPDMDVFKIALGERIK